MSFETTSIDSDVEVKFQNLLELLLVSCERVNNSCGEAISVFSHNIIKVISCVPIVQIHRQFILFSHIEMIRENFLLLFFCRPFQSVIIQSTLAYCDNFRFYSHKLFLQLLKILLNWFRSLHIKRLLCATWMHSNCSIAVLISLAHLVWINSVLDTTCSNQQVITSNMYCSLNYLKSVIWMILFSVINSTKLFVSQVCSNVVESVFGEFLLHWTLKKKGIKK